ncbi:erythromycin esterase family protein [Streptosporangium sp. NPDC048047]|uniref:erythromycin esterase family protein n=1 Tax=Streptosporangium sp. NPDC048047 TaxID=3155748 RepID=UPI00344A4787
MGDARTRTPLTATLAALTALAVPPMLAATGCAATKVDTSHVTSDAVVAVGEAPLDTAASRRLVGIGEATHGNREFAQVRLSIIRTLVREHGFRAIALEADFGGTAAADDYVRENRGSAEEAATALGFDIYRTRETADLLTWIHDHNATVSDADKVRLYGFDMQRYDLNKKRLLSYLAQVDPALGRQAETSLADLTDAGRARQDEKKTAAAATAAERIVAQMRTGRERYVKASSPEAFVLAAHHAETILRGARLQTSGDRYAAKRDAWMAENVTWITDVEAGQGRKQLVLAGHNGHIDKSGAAFSYESMGRRLAAAYGGDYFTIGTDFGESTFISKDEASGERKRFSVTNPSPLAKLFGSEPLGYVDIRRASAQPANRKLLNTEIPMGSVGDAFQADYSGVLAAYTVKTVPAKAYDALVYAPHASPVTPL